MKCSKFPDRDAAGVCAYSGKPYCAEELVEVDGKMYGKENLGKVMADLKEKQRAEPAQPMIFMNAGGGGGAAASSSSAAGQGAYPIGTKSRGLAVLLAWLLGGLGAHKFYLGQPIWGLIYLVFCWTGIPSVIGFIEGIGYLLTSEAVFARRYG